MNSDKDKQPIVPKDYLDLAEIASQDGLLFTIAEHLSDAIIKTDAFFTIESWNSSAAELFGFSFGEMVGRKVSDTIAHESHFKGWKNITDHLLTNNTWNGQLETRNKRGDFITVDCVVVSLKQNENPGYLLIIKSSPVLSSAHAVFRERVLTQSFVNALAEGLLVQNKMGEILFANKVAESITGLTAKQMTDRVYLETSWKSFTENGKPFTWDSYPSNAVLRTGRPQRNVVQGVQKEEGVTWMNVNSLPVFHEKTKELLGVVTSFTDITEIRLTQQALKESEEKWRSVLNSNKNGIFLIDNQYRIRLVNDIAVKRHLQVDQLTHIREGISFFEVLPEGRRAIVKEMLDRAFRGEEVEYEVLYSKTNNEDLWLFASYSPVRNAEGEITAVCFTVSDITSIKKNEAALSRSEQRWKFALDGAGDGVWEYNFQTRESYYSPLYKTMLGFAENEFKNEAGEWNSRIHPDDVEKVNDIDRLYENGIIENHSVEYRMMNKAGEYIWVLDRGMLLDRTPDGRPLVLIGTHKDVTDRKVREENLIQSRRLFSSFMANTPTMAWIVDEKNVFRYLNAPYLKAFNLTEDDIGKSLYEIFPADIVDRFVENNWKVWNSNASIETIEDGVGPDGAPQLYHIFKFPLESEDGVRLLGGVALDITQKAMLEQQLAEEQETKKREIIQAIINAQENERKELAYELHDNVNQILSSSRLMLEVAVEKPEGNKDFVSRSLSYLQDAINELRKISHSLIPGTLRDISLEAAIEEVIQNINSTQKLRIHYAKKIETSGKIIQPDIQLTLLRIAQEQFNNILKHANASEAYMYLFISEDIVSMTIQDNGRGFDTAITKKGLGLNNIFNRVEYYSGTVTLDSAPGKGCKLHIEFPA